MLSQTRFSLALVAAGVFLAAGCQKGAETAKPGTPAFYWAAARENYSAGNYLKTTDNLVQLTRTENEYTGRARPWLLVLASGTAAGYIELADSFDTGVKIARANAPVFRRQISAARGEASTASLLFAETCHKFMDTSKNDPVKLEFSFPSASAAEPPQLARIAKGMLVPPAEIEALQPEVVGRGVSLAVARAVGAKGDPAKAREAFKDGSAAVPRTVFLVGMAQSLYEQGDLFAPMKMDQPQRVKILYTEALEALAAVPQTKETKKLKDDIQGKLKKFRIPS